MRTIKKLLIALMLTLPMAVVADYLFKTLDARDGLTSSQVNCILKDSRGYVWFGTPAGLYRFDGYTFRNFQSDSQDGSSLNDSYINSIQEMLDGNLLIETSSGYCVYHPQTESFERDMKQTFARMGIETIPSVVYIDRHKNLWGAIPNKGVVCYNQQQQLLYEFGYTDDAHGVPQGAALILTVVVVIVLAVLGKYVGCSLGAKIGDKTLEKSSLNIIGIGMVPRGEVGIIVASIGLKIVVDGGTAISQELYTVVVLMSVITTIIAPPLLSSAYRKKYTTDYVVQPDDQI